MPAVKSMYFLPNQNLGRVIVGYCRWCFGVSVLPIFEVPEVRALATGEDDGWARIGREEEGGELLDKGC